MPVLEFSIVETLRRLVDPWGQENEREIRGDI